MTLLPILSVKDLSVSFQNQGCINHIVQNVSFDVQCGQTVALVGESGSGKSLTALSVMGLLPYPMAYHPTGSIIYQNGAHPQELLNMGENTLRAFRGRDIGMIFQEPLSALNPLHVIEKQIGESLKIHTNLTDKQIKTRVLELLEMVEFPDGHKRLLAYPHQLSGGQRQRVMIAMALACKPKILIADEPTTALDVTIQKGIIQLIKKLSVTENMGIILISHDLNMVHKLADHVCVMKDGQIVEQGACQNILLQPTHAYTKKLIQAEPSGAPIPLKDDAQTILRTQDITVSFDAKKLFSFKRHTPFIAVNKISLNLKQGETLGIVGESGSGKTTLGLALLKLVPSTGSLVFCGHDIRTVSAKNLRLLRKNMQFIFQDPFSSLNPRYTVENIIGEGLRIHQPGLDHDTYLEKIRSALCDVGLSADMLHRYPHEFSGGQRQRMSIARSLVLHPQLLVLDEPTSALDRSVQYGVIELLRNLQKKYNLSYVFISHDLAVVQAMSHRILVMKNGQIVEEGDSARIITAPEKPYTKALVAAALF